ncbi:FixH family protein [Kutzneria sp. NPDC051319]|uniref:FixH family protein n=1 Tax=Kutzneria sp. NPDC051319 TaxID=3155047 RepID=UPI00342AAA51
MTRARWAALAPAAAVLVAALTGCGQSAASQNGANTTCTDSKSNGGVTIVLATTPCPIKGGESANAHITVKDSGGKAVTNATVKVTTEMPAMNMRGGDQNASPSGDGYDTKVVLGMGGDWNVTVQVSGGSVSSASAQFTLSAK